MSLSTPLSVSSLTYEDSPSANLNFLKSLSSLELKLYAKGYIQCSTHVQETIVDSKNKFLNVVLLHPENKELFNYVRLLDSLESTLKEKVKILKEYWPEDDPL